VDDKLVIMRKEAAVRYFNLLFQYFTVSNEKNDENVSQYIRFMGLHSNLGPPNTKQECSNVQYVLTTL
jgi:hypothetical protein